MTSHKKWTGIVLAAIALMVGSVVAVNVTVDAYGILRTDFTRQFQVPNMNVIKATYLLKNRNRYDSYIFGSSRVGNIDQSKIRNGTYYNMMYPLGLPEEHLRNIRFFLEKGIAVKNILIGIDEFSFLIDPQQRRSDLLAQPHPEVSGKNLQTFYGEYFFRLRGMISQLKAYIDHNYTRRNDPAENKVYYDIYSSGRILCSDCDKGIELNNKKHFRQLPVMSSLLFDGDYVDESVRSLREIVELSKQHGFTLTLFINPIYQYQYLAIDLQKAARFKRKLAGISDYYDFSGLNTITTNGYFYYEAVHFRPLVGDMMLSVMFGEPHVAVPRDFGFHVTKANVDDYLRNQCREIREIGKSVSLNQSNMSYADSCDDAFPLKTHDAIGRNQPS